jgi:hypothetical protein
MIVSVLISIEEIVAKGRDFPRPRVVVCPRCDSNRGWGHGFESAFFDGRVDGVLLRRSRCPDCHCVLRLQLSGFFKRFQASIKTIGNCIFYRSKNGRKLSYKDSEISADFMFFER